MIDFTNLQGLSIPQGDVVKITRNGAVLWEIGGDEPVVPTYTNQLPRAQAIDSTEPYNGLGYKTGYYLTSSGTFEATGKSNEWLTGYIPYTIGKPIHIKGVSFTTASHDRMYFFSDKTTRVAPAINSGTTNLVNYFTIENLGTNHFKLTPISGSGFSDTTQFVRMGFTTGIPSAVIITIDEEIL